MLLTINLCVSGRLDLLNFLFRNKTGTCKPMSGVNKLVFIYLLLTINLCIFGTLDLLNLLFRNKTGTCKPMSGVNKLVFIYFDHQRPISDWFFHVISLAKSSSQRYMMEG